MLYYRTVIAPSTTIASSALETQDAGALAAMGVVSTNVAALAAPPSPIRYDDGSNDARREADAEEVDESAFEFHEPLYNDRNPILQGDEFVSTMMMCCCCSNQWRGTHRMAWFEQCSLDPRVGR